MKNIQMSATTHLGTSIARAWSPLAGVLTLGTTNRLRADS